jgi:hypothetical protein
MYHLIMTIILYLSDTASLSSVMICCTTMATFIMSLLDELRAYTDRPVFEFPVMSDSAVRGAARFFHLCAVSVVAGVACLDAMQLHRITLVR